MGLIRWKRLSERLSVKVVSAMAVLLLASLAVMLIYARKTVKEEAILKASQTLEGTMLRIDDIMLSVEQTASNLYFHMLPYLKSEERMLKYSRELVEANSYVDGCAIAFAPGFFKEDEPFMAYYHRAGDTIVRSESFASSPYTEQAWFTEPMTSGKIGWMRPIKENVEEAKTLVTFCLPIYSRDAKPIGVMGVDLSLGMLSQILLGAKPSANSYCTLLDADGTYIIHPDSDKLFHQTIFTQLEHGADPSVKVAGEAMLSGGSGYKEFQMDGTDYYVFYKPFKRNMMRERTMDNLKWSTGVIYPEEDIFGDYNSLSYYVMAIAFVGLLLLFVLCRMFLHRHLKPLRALSAAAQRIAEGHYDETIPDSRYNYEIGRLQDNFRQMQQALAIHIGELEQLKTTLRERGEVLKNAYKRAQKADRLKMTFLHNMTNQMVGPAETIDRDVIALSEIQLAHSAECTRLAEDIQENGKTITELLDNLIVLSDEDNRKEEDHE